MLKLKFLLCSILLISSTIVSAADTIRIIVPWGAGGIADRMARAVQQTLINGLDKSITVVVETHPSVGGVIGTKLVADSKKNETVLLVNSAVPVVNLINQPGGENIQKNLVPVAFLGNLQQVLVASKKSQINSVKDLVNYNGSQPLFVGTSGAGSQALTTGILKAELNKNIVLVPYKGEQPMLVDLLGNNLDLVILSVSLTESHVNEGNIKMLAVTGKHRNPKMPNVPTFAETGLQNLSNPPNMNLVWSNPTADPKLINLVKKALYDAYSDPVKIQSFTSLGLNGSAKTVLITDNTWSEYIALVRKYLSKIQLDM